MSSLARQERQDIMYLAIKERPGEPLTIPTLAESLGRRPNSTFGLDLAAVRHRFLDEGDDCTNCFYDVETNGYVFYYLPSGQEAGHSVAGIMAANAQVRARIHNNARHGHYAATNAADSGDRAYGRVVEEIQNHVVGIWQTLDTFVAAQQETPAT